MDGYDVEFWTLLKPFKLVISALHYIQGTRERKRLCKDLNTHSPIYDDTVCDLLTIEGQMQQTQMCKLQECPGWPDNIESSLFS